MLFEYQGGDAYLVRMAPERHAAFSMGIIERPKDQADATPVSGVTPVGISVPIGSLNRLLLWGMFLATLPNSLLRYGCEIFATLRIFLNRVTIQDRFSAEVLSKQ
jgi:hypothetical protein